jgi:hypothetical protein
MSPLFIVILLGLPVCIRGGALGSLTRRRRLPIPLPAAGWPSSFSRSLFPPGRFASGARV